MGDRGLGGAGAGVRVGERLGPGPGLRRRQRERRRRWRSRKSRDRNRTGARRIRQKSREHPATTPLERPGLARMLPGNEVMAGGRRLGLWDV